MLRLAIDVREACRSQKTGKGQWTKGFVTELLAREGSFTLFTDAQLPSEWNATSVECRCYPGGLRWHLNVANEMKRRSGEIDCYVSPTSILVPFLLGTLVRTVPIIHDLIAFRREPHDRRAKLIERLLMRRALKKASHVCTVSEHTKKDLLQRYSFMKSDDVTTVFAGPLRDTPPLHSSGEHTILCVGTLCPRKNQLRLIKAFHTLPDPLRAQWRIILAGGRGWQDQEIIHEVQKTPGVQWRGHVTDDEYEELLGKATILALPSLYEGFGLQVLDALQRGIPLLLSDRGSLPEIAGEAAHYVDPESIHSISHGLRELLTNTCKRALLGTKGVERAKRFSWQRTVDIFLSAIH